MYCVAHVVGFCKRRERHHSTLACTTIYTYVRFAHTYTNHAVVNAVDTYIFATWVFAFLEERFVDLFAKHHHFAALAVVNLVEKSAIFHRLMLDAIVGSFQTLHRAVVVFIIVIYNRLAPHRRFACQDVYFINIVANGVEVFSLNIPITPFVETFVRHAGVVGECEARVCGKTIELRVEHLLQTIATAREQHEHKYAPKHSERRQKTSRSIACKSVENFG